jgi:antitoxin component of MazEF toxin-antitoxin module
VPKDYLQRFNIQRRAELELTDDGILIRPVTHAHEATTAASARTAPADATTERAHWWQRRKKNKAA